MIGHAGFQRAMDEADLKIIRVQIRGDGGAHEGVGLPIIQQRDQGERRVRGRGVAGLIGGVDAVATGAGADFAGRKREPVTFAHDADVVGVGQLPRERAARGHERGL